MKIGPEVGEFESGPHRSRRLLGVVILVLFITGCIGLQVLLYLASSGTENKLWRIGILANSTADYSLDEIIHLAPISPEILEELAREDARSSPTPGETGTPPAIGQIVPTSTSGTGEGTNPTPIVTVQPTAIPTGNETPITPTPVSPSPTTPIPVTQTPKTQSPTRTPTTPVPTTKVPTTPAATTTIPPMPTTRVPTTPTATTTIPPTPTPTTRVPTTPAATTTIPPTPIPITQAPTPTPTATPVPTSTGVVEIPTPWVPPTEPPIPTEEVPPGSGLDATSTRTPPKHLLPTRLDVFYLKSRTAPQGCQFDETLGYSFENSHRVVLLRGGLNQVGIKISLFSNGRFRSMA